MQDLVYIDEYGLLGTNFYWKHRNKLPNITDKDLEQIGLVDERVLVHKDIIEILQEIDKKFQEKGYRMYIKEGYRSKELYELIYQKRVEMFGKERTDALLNMQVMPHASGKTVDVALWSIKEDKEVFLRNKDDGDGAYFINFYKDKDDAQSKHYQELQDLLINTMQEHGFRLGTKREYFHFDYKPETEKNYNQ